MTQIDLPSDEAEAYFEFQNAVRDLAYTEKALKAAQDRANQAIAAMQRHALKGPNS